MAMLCRTTVVLFGGLGLAVVSDAARAAEPPPAPAVSTFAPADELGQQVTYYIDRINQAVASEADYDEAMQARVKKDANTLIVLVLNLGLHDQDNPIKPRAPAVLAAAQSLARASDHASATQGIADVSKALSGPAVEGELKWERVASLGQLMKQVPVVHTALKRGMTPARFERMASQTAPQAATIAAIAQASIADTHEVKNPDDTQKWFDFCADMRDAAAEVGAAVRGGNQEAANAAMLRLNRSCDTCHATFRVELTGQSTSVDRR